MLAGFDAWVATLAALAREVDDEPPVHDPLRRLFTKVTEPRVTVTFGGHFSSGKSTIINAVLGRSLLPVSDFPETGVITVIRAGEAESAYVETDSGRRCIPLATEAIAQEAAVISEHGERRLAVQEVGLLDLTVPAGRLPPRAAWVDSPGINDSVFMNSRALEAAQRADVLLWVLASRQPLAEVEVDFLAGYVAERGPHSVVLVLNIFLEEDTPAAWERYCATKLAYVERLVEHRAALMGFTPTTPPELLVVSGRALRDPTRPAFGGSALLSVLDALGRWDDPRVQRSRLFGAVGELQAVAGVIQACADAERASITSRHEAVEARRKQALSLRQQFARSVEDLIGGALAEWSVGARAEALRHVGMLNTNARGSVGSTAQLLMIALRGIAAASTSRLIFAITQEAMRFGQAPLSAEGNQSLRHLFIPGEITLQRVDTAPARRQAASVQTLMKPARAGTADVVEAAQAALLSATERTIAEMLERRNQAFSIILRNCADPAAHRSLYQPDAAVARPEKWGELLAKVTHLSARAKAML